MKALALLSKFQGRYDEWKAIRSRYDLKWAGESSLEVFNRIANNSAASYDEMLAGFHHSLIGLTDEELPTTVRLLEYQQEVSAPSLILA